MQRRAPASGCRPLGHRLPAPVSQPLRRLQRDRRSRRGAGPRPEPQRRHGRRRASFRGEADIDVLPSHAAPRRGDRRAATLRRRPQAALRGDLPQCRRRPDRRAAAMGPVRGSGTAGCGGGLSRRRGHQADRPRALRPLAAAQLPRFSVRLHARDGLPDLLRPARPFPWAQAFVRRGGGELPAVSGRPVARYDRDFRIAARLPQLRHSRAGR